MQDSERLLTFQCHHPYLVLALLQIQLLDLIKNAKPSHLSKYVLILTDEVYLKEGLVYNRIMH